MLQLSTQGWLRLHWVSMVGPDAADFLHRMTTVHVKALGIGQGALGCFLTPQGRIRVAFSLWRYGPQEFAFELEGADWKDKLLTTIDEFTFGEKFTLTDVSGLESAWVLASGAEDLAKLEEALGTGLPAEGSTLATESRLRINRHSNDALGCVWISLWGQERDLHPLRDGLALQAQKLDEATFEALRCKNLWPRLGHELTTETSPLDAGFAVSIAENKGCYPGQEVIEKIVSLGSPPRRLARLSVAGARGPHPTLPLELKSQAEGNAQTLGWLTTWSGDQALAVIQKVAAKPGLAVRFASGSDWIDAQVVEVGELRTVGEPNA